MDCPQPPRDVSLRNIIDKLAEFVARNGPEFEIITKQKQQGNPKFEFLYGGEYASYYQYRVAAEHAFLKQQGSISQAQSVGASSNGGQSQILHQQQQHFNPQTIQPAVSSMQQAATDHTTNTLYGGMNQPNVVAPQMWGAANQQPPQQATTNTLALNLTTQIEAINMQQNALRDQIHQSESNLSAQHSAMMAQQTKQIEDAIEQAQNRTLEMQAEENGISLKEFDAILQPIVESCTKDSISSGKNWILQHSSDSAKNNVVLQYLLKKALLNGSTFTQKLHLIYLVNDILHHCVRKNANDLKNSLENVVIPMFCSADLIANKEQRAKLTKLLSLWESKAKFFDACVITKLQSPDSSMQEYKTNLQNVHHEITANFTQSTKATLDNYQKQHQVFIQHATQQIAHFEQQKQQIEQQLLATVLPANVAVLPPTNKQQAQQQLTPSKLPALMAQQIRMPTVDDNDVVDDNDNIFNLPQQQQQQQQQQHNNFAANPGFQQQQQQLHNPFKADAMTMDNDFQNSTNNFFIPDLSKPPPGFLATLTAAAAAAVIATQQQLQQQQQQPSPQNYSQLNPGAVTNEPSNISESSSDFDILAANAAIQLLQHHQQQLEQQQQLDLQQQIEQLQQQQPQQHQQQQSQMPLSLQEEDLSAHLMPIHIEEDQVPSAPYYDLPAGLMVPLILLEDYKYKPLNPDDIRLPPPAPQSERLTNALTAFYAPPSHDRPRDNEGWEKLALYEYYKVKNAAKKQKEDAFSSGAREKSRSPSPIVLEKPKPKKLNKRCYKSKSRSRSRSPYRSRSRSPPARNKDKPRTRFSQRNRSPRRSPTQRDRIDRERNDRERIDREKERDRERERERERDNNNNNSNNNNSNRNDNRSERNNTRRERERSITPPNFVTGNFAKPNEFIEESNKGHQMLMKMGWTGSGTGLGNKGQGIDKPIAGGEVRDRQDMYKGIGININDPFENFRKNKGAAFVHRMRSREEKS